MENIKIGVDNQNWVFRNGFQKKDNLLQSVLRYLYVYEKFVEYLFNLVNFTFKTENTLTLEQKWSNDKIFNLQTCKL